jgi:carbon monoxide dehydrogenase subunit G
MARVSEVSHRETTAATTADVWRWYADVDRWRRWDGGVQSVELDGPFETGTRGHVILPNGRRGRLTLLDVTPGTTFTDVVKLSLLKLTTRHELTATALGTEITHTIAVTGLMARFFPRLLTIPIRRALPASVAQLAFLAAREPVA